jgi:WD40 repeat protein
MFTFEVSFTITEHLKNFCQQQFIPSLQSHNKKIQMSHHPHKPAIATIGDSLGLLIWETQHMQIIAIKNLEQIPTCLQFLPDGNSIVVGFANGDLLFFDTSPVSLNTEEFSLEILH